MDKGVLALAAALIGAVSGVLGGYLAAVRQASLERAKWLRAREDDVRRDTRGAVSSLMKQLAVGIHSMMWVTWKTLEHGGVASDEDIAQYEKEYHQLVGDIVSAQMVLASIDLEMYERITPIVSNTIKVGSTTYKALNQARTKSNKSEEALRQANQEAFELIKSVPERVAELIRT